LSGSATVDLYGAADLTHIKDITFTFIPETNVGGFTDTAVITNIESVNPNVTTVTPTPPTFTDDVCVNSAPSGAIYVITATTGVSYFVNGVLTVAGVYSGADGFTVTITAQAKSGFVLTGTTTFVHQFASTPTCTVPPTISTTSLSDATVGSSYTSTVGGSGTTPITWSASGLPGGLSMSTSGTISGTPTAGGAFTVTVTAANGTAPDATKPLSLTVDPGSQSIMFGAFSSIGYGDSVPSLGASASSGLPVSYAVAGTCTETGVGASAALTITGAGTCKVTASQAGNADYAAAVSVEQDLTINQASQSINFGTFAAISFGDAAPALTAGATSGLTVSYAVSGPCSVSDGASPALSITGVGTCKVTASQAGNANYSAASAVERDLTINPQTQTIMFAPLSAISFGQAAPVIAAMATSGLAVSYTVTGPCTIAANGQVSYSAAGTCVFTATQAGNSTYSAATPVMQDLVISAAATVLSKVSASSSSVFVADTYTATLTSPAAPNGVAGVTITFTTGTGPNTVTICTATTNTHGVASCTPTAARQTLVTQALIANKYLFTAAFAGNTDYQPNQMSAKAK
jgi:hypothetical protein